MALSARVIMFLKNWNEKCGCNGWMLFSIVLLIACWILLDVVGRSDEMRKTLWLSEGQLNRITIVTFYLPVSILAVSVVCSLVDFLSYCFRILNSFTDEKNWYTSGRMKRVMKNPPRSAEEAARVELDLFRDLSYEIKYIMIKLSLRFVIVISLFVLGFAEIYAFINRISVSPGAYTDIDWNAALPWHIFYSLDVMTTLGGAAPIPEYENALIWWASGFQLFFSVVITVLFLTLAITSIFETFTLKTSYIPSFVKYHYEKAKNATKS